MSFESSGNNFLLGLKILPGYKMPNECLAVSDGRSSTV